MASDDLRRQCARAASNVFAEDGGTWQEAADAVIGLVEEDTAERLRAELTAKLGLCCEPCQENRHADCTGFCQSSCCAAWDDAVRDTAERIAAWLESEAQRITNESEFGLFGAHNLREPSLLLAYAKNVRSGAWKEQPCATDSP